MYGLFYWGSRLSLGNFTSVVLYLGYLFLISFLDFLVTGEYAFGMQVGESADGSVLVV